MIMEAYAVYDKAANAYLPLFFVRSKGEAIRSFGDAVNKQDHQFSAHAEDYVLFFVGSFDDANGIFFGDSPEKVITAMEVRQVVQ